MNSRMTPLQHLQRTAVLGAICGCPGIVSTDTLEKDGRKRDKVVRELYESDMAEPAPTNAHRICVRPTQKCLDSIEQHGLDLTYIWTHQNENAPERLKMPWVRIDDLTTEQLKMILDEFDEYLFCVVDCAPYQYGVRWTDNSGDVNVGRNNCYWEGPLTLADAQERLPEIQGQEWDFSSGFEIVVTNKELGVNIAKREFNGKIERLLQNNLCWALVECGIISKSKVFNVHDSDEDKDTPKFTTSKRDGLFPSYTNLGEDPTQWETQFGGNIERIVKRIGDLNEQLTMLMLLQKSMAEYGGWDLFIETYRGKLVEHLETEGEDNE